MLNSYIVTVDIKADMNNLVETLSANEFHVLAIHPIIRTIVVSTEKSELDLIKFSGIKSVEISKLIFKASE